MKLAACLCSSCAATQQCGHCKMACPSHAFNDWLGMLAWLVRLHGEWEARTAAGLTTSTASSQAVQWWNAGCRSFEDVEAAAAASANRPGGDVSLTQRGSLAADSRGMEARSRGAAAPAGPDLDAEAGGDDTFEAVSFEGPPGMEEPGYASDTSGSRRTVVVPRQIRYCLKHRSDLLEDVASSELAEMRSVVLEGLEAVSGAPGPWRIEQVGGGRRTQQAHDADWLVTHPVAGVEGVALRLYEWLVAKGRVVSQKDGFCVMQVGGGDRCSSWWHGCLAVVGLIM